MSEEVVNSGAIIQNDLTLFMNGKCEGKMYSSLLEIFEPFYNQAKEWELKAKELVVENSGEIDKMKDARTARLALVKVRTSIEKKRIDLNEDAKKQTKTINEIAKFLTSLVEPTEEHLLEQERFAENERLLMQEKIKAERATELEKYNVDISYLDLINMPEETFQNLLNNSKILFDAKIKKEAEEKELAELRAKIDSRIIEIAGIGYKKVGEGNDHFRNEEIDHEITLTELTGDDDFWSGWIAGAKISIQEMKDAKEKAAQIEAERLEKENARLRAENEEKERIANAAKKRQETANDRQSKLLNIDCPVTFEQVADMTDQQFDIFYSEKDQEYKEKKNQEFIKEQKRKFDEAQAKKKADEEAAEKRRLELAPDKEKLKRWLNSQLMIMFDTSTVSKESAKIANDIEQKFKAFNKWANEQIDGL